MKDDIIYGRNPVIEALEAGKTVIDKIWIQDGLRHSQIAHIRALAKDRGILYRFVDRRKLDTLCEGENHQGVAAAIATHAYAELEDILKLAEDRGEPPFLVIAEGITDPHNLGAIIRSAECAGAHGVIIPERRAVGLTPAAVKASAGAVEYLPVAREVNLTRTIERLKKEGVWIYGTAMNGEDYRKVDFSGPKALVIGSEGEGMSRLVGESCDKIVTLPMKGKIESLNASVAAGILLYAMMDAK